MNLPVIHTSRAMKRTFRNALITPESSPIVRLLFLELDQSQDNFGKNLSSTVVCKKKTALFTHCLVIYKKNYYTKQNFPSLQKHRRQAASTRKVQSILFPCHLQYIHTHQQEPPNYSILLIQKKNPFFNVCSLIFYPSFALIQQFIAYLMFSMFKRCVVALHLLFPLFTSIPLEHFPQCIVNMHPLIGPYTFSHSDKSRHTIQKQLSVF